MRSDSNAIALPGDFIELRPADAEMFRKLRGVQIFREMSLDIFVDPNREFLPVQGYHPLHAQIGGDCLHDMGGGRDIILRDDGLLSDGCFQSRHINMVIFAALLHLFPSVAVRGIGEDMAEK